jgi:TIR domain/CHAT domain
MTDNQAQSGQKPKNFFISYTNTDRAWAEWIAMQLENAGYTTIIQAWDILPGANFVAEMDEAAKQAERTIPVLSSAYLGSLYAFAEWAAAFRHDPTGKLRKVLPVRIEHCVVEGLLGPIVYIDLVDLLDDEPRAREQLLAGVKQGRAKPISVAFPGSPKHSVPQTHTAFPGSASQSQNVPSPHTALSTGRDEKTMQKIKALFLAANPASMSQLAIDKEMRAIEQKVHASEHRDVLVFQSAWAVQPDDLLQLLNQHKPHIVHFSGHGRSEGLSLVGENGQERLVTTRALKSLFTTLKDNIRLVFLNACYSREQAQALIETIDCMIGMKEGIHDDAAIAFASSFYRAIGFGRSVQEAFDQGITSLLLEGIPDEDLPELLVKQGVDAKQVTLIASANP